MKKNIKINSKTALERGFKVGAVIVSLIGVYFVLTIVPKLFLAMVLFIAAYLIFADREKIKNFKKEK